MRRAHAASLTIAVTVAVLVMGLATSAAVSPATGEFVEESEDWCSDRDGDLYNANALWGHGGLHCELPNGSSVHMTEVVTNGK